jgi:hypothetical protein
VFYLFDYDPLWWAKSLLELSQVFSPASCLLLLLVLLLLQCLLRGDRVSSSSLQALG